MMILIFIPLIFCALCVYLAYETGFKTKDKEDFKYSIVFIACALIMLVMAIGMFCDFSNRNNYQCRQHHHCCHKY